jgi:hypothetical protein
MSVFHTCIVLHLAVTLFLTGLIWIIQLVHYPLMTFVADAEFVAFERAHCKRIGAIVAPAMILEGILAVALCVLAKSRFRFGLCVVGVALSLLIWLSTFLVQVPIHNKLASGRSVHQIQRLVSTNWIRTIAWSLRSAIAIVLCLDSVLAVGAMEA